MDTMEHNKSNTLLSKADLTNMNLDNFKMFAGMGLKNYCIVVTLNGITSIINFIKIYLSVQKLLVEYAQTESHFGMIEVTFYAITTIQNFI
jgi:hypothetical protein